MVVNKLNKQKFKEVLYPIHKTFWEIAYKKLSAKMSRLKSSLKRRSGEYNVEFSIEGDDIRKMFFEVYGKPCKYCEKKLTFRTIACDHIVPLSKKGGTTVKNLQLICSSCNARKGPLNEEEFGVLIQHIQDLPEEICKYVMRKLAKGGRY